MGGEGGGEGGDGRVGTRTLRQPSYLFSNTQKQPQLAQTIVWEEPKWPCRYSSVPALSILDVCQVNYNMHK